MRVFPCLVAKVCPCTLLSYITVHLIMVLPIIHLVGQITRHHMASCHEARVARLLGSKLLCSGEPSYTSVSVCVCTLFLCLSDYLSRCVSISVLGFSIFPFFFIFFFCFCSIPFPLITLSARFTTHRSTNVTT